VSELKEVEKQAPGPFKVLLVDDSVATVRLLENLLRNSNFNPCCVYDGATCLTEAKALQPEIILLDYNLPDIEGPEVCRLLKENSATKNIPVIFLTVNTGNAYLVKAFDAGAADYVTKPFNFIELTTRIRTQIELRRAKDRLTEMNKELEEINDQKDEMLGVVSHDLKNPIAAVQSLAEILQIKDDWSEEERDDLIENIRKSAVYMGRLVEEVLEMNSIARGAITLKIVEFDWLEVTERCIHTNLSNATQKGQNIHFVHDRESYPIVSDERVCFQIMDNLLSNAVKFSPPNKDITFILAEEDGHIRCSVVDQGPGLSKEDQKKLFGKFTKLSARPTGGESSTGLGLSIVKKLVHALNGDIWCESELGKGATFCLKVPMLNCDMNFKTVQNGPSRPSRVAEAGARS